MTSLQAEIAKKPFGETKSGEQATLYTITNESGSSISLTDYGATLQSVLVPDQEGKLGDVVFGFDDVTGYQSDATVTSDAPLVVMPIELQRVSFLLTEKPTNLQQITIQTTPRRRGTQL